MRADPATWGESPALAIAPLTEQAGLIRTKRLSARELLAAVLAQIDRCNPAINAIATLAPERAFEEARRCDQLAAKGEWLGPLHGLPCTIKDALDTEGIRTTAGAVELADRVPGDDACAVARVRGAGAIVLAKTNLPRWSGDLQTRNELFGVTNNPYDLERVPGGSSGGSAAAVATGMNAFDLGTDIGGSIRIPSSFCGTAGHKPTFGIVPQRGYVSHVGGGTTLSDINVVGPMARHVGDLDVLLDVLAGPDADDQPWSLNLPPAVASPWRLATYTGGGTWPVSHEVKEALDRAAAVLDADGTAVLSDEPLPVSLDEAVEVFLPLVGAAVLMSSLDHLAPDETAGGSGGSHLEWLRHDIRRVELRAAWDRWFERHDVLLLPAWPTPAYRHDQRPLGERTLSVDDVTIPMVAATAWLGGVGVVGLPSTVVRVATSSEGLPIGIQVVGARYRDRTTLAVAKRLEELLGGYQPPPLLT